eukprot:3637306-Rhodomonas_salina.3
MSRTGIADAAVYWLLARYDVPTRMLCIVRICCYQAPNVEQPFHGPPYAHNGPHQSNRPFRS